MTETPWTPEPSAESKRDDVLSYMAALDDSELSELVTEARSTGKDAAAAKIEKFLKGKQ